MEECLAPEEVDGFLTGALAPASLGRVEAHLDICASCRRLVGKIAQATDAGQLADTITPDLADTAAERPMAQREQQQVRKIDRYVVKRELGSGGMGVVYEATDPELGRDVAIKTLRRGAYAERLRREAQALAKLNHPNVVAVYDVGEYVGGVFVAMALVDGKNLREWLATEHPVDEILHVLLAAARGIIAAHAAGLIHRDLKPDNIFVASDGNVLVGDFGLAREVGTTGDDVADRPSSPATNLTQTGTVLGTPAYMAPEQAMGEASERSDQFSFCVMAYEALYGQRPFTGNTLEELLDSVQSGELAAPKRVRGIPERVSAAIKRGLSADPSARFSSMATLVAALEPRKRMWPWLAAGAAAIAIGATAFALTRSDPEAECAPAKQQLAGVWNPAQRAAVIAKLATFEIRGAVAENIADRLADHATRWTTTRHAVCIDAATSKLPKETTTAQDRCLDVNRLYFETELSTLLTAKDSLAPETQWQRIASLPVVEACRGAEANQLGSLGPQHLELVRDLSAAVASGAALDAFGKLRERAEAANDQVAQLEIALAEAHRAVGANQPADADAAIQRALVLAETLDLPSRRVRALAMAARSKCDQNADPKVLLDLAISASKRLRDDHDALAIDELLDARAVCAFKAKQYADSAKFYEELLARSLARYGPDNLGQLQARGQLVIVYQQIGRDDEAAKHHDVVIKTFTRIGGDAIANGTRISVEAEQAFAAGDLATAIAKQWRALDLFNSSDKTPPATKAWLAHHLATFLEIDASFAAAEKVHLEVLRLLPDAQSDAGLEGIRGYAFAFIGTSRLIGKQFAEAAEHLEKALAIARKGNDSLLLVITELNLGRAWVGLGEWRRGAKQIREGFATQAKLPEAAFRTGMAEHALAQAEWGLGNKEVARELARNAELHVSKGVEDTKRQAVAKNLVPVREAALAEVVKWRDEHR